MILSISHSERFLIIGLLRMRAEFVAIQTLMLNGIYIIIDLDGRIGVGKCFHVMDKLTKKVTIVLLQIGGCSYLDR